MSRLIERLSQAQQKAMSIRPKVGGFPVMAEVFRQAGVHTNRWILPACQSVYFMKEGAVVQQGIPIVAGLHDVPVFDRDEVIKAIRRDQEGKSTFAEFLTAVWEAGVVSYDVDFLGRKVSYFGMNGESYVETYPSVQL